MTPEQSIARANNARRILNDPMVGEALDQIERACRERWETSEPADVEARELAYRRWRAARDFRAIFEAAISDGRVAEFELQMRTDNG